MLGEDLFRDDAFSALRKGISAASLRQQVIAGNIANINTPGYKKQEVSFEDEFRQAVASKYGPQMEQTDPRHFPAGKNASSIEIKVNTVDDTTMRYDGNNVDVDEEMTKLAENGLRFNAMAQLIGTRFAMLKSVISEGRR